MKYIKKENIEDLYIKQQLTTQQIANIYNCDRTTISNYLKKYNIPRNFKQRKFQDIKNIPLTQEQIEITIGTVLGDATLTAKGRKNKSYMLMVSHCDKQKDYVVWKKEKFGKLVNREVHKWVDPRGNSTMWSISTLVHEDFRKFYHLFYDENLKKIIRQELLNYITPLSVAVWFLDDGSCGKSSMSLATDSFTKQENELIQNMFKEKFNIGSKIREYERHGKKFYYLKFNKPDAILLTELIRPYIEVECMKYKLLKY